jgi:hypothetical protein
MPTFADLLSSQIPDPDPSDQLRDQLGQGQNITGLSPQPGQGAAPPPQVDPALMMGGGPPGMGGAPGMAPSPNVPGPLAALAPKPGAGKPKIRLKSSAYAKPPAKKIKPKIKLKASAYGGPI